MNPESTAAPTPEYTIQKGKLPRFARLGLIWDLLGGVRLLYGLALAALAVEACFTFVAPVAIKITIDSVIGTQSPSLPPLLAGLGEALLGGFAEDGSWLARDWLRQRLWVPGGLLLLLTLAQMAAGFAAKYLAAQASESLAKNLRCRLYGHIQDLPYEALLRAQTGDWQQRLSSDVDTVRRFLSSELFEIGRTLLLFAAALPVMLWLSAELSLWGVLVLPLIMAFSIVFFQVVQKAFLKMDEAEGALSNIIQENITGIRVVRAFARQKLELGRFGAASDLFRDKTYWLIFAMGVYWGGTSLLGIVQVALVLGIGLGMITGGVLSVGTLVVFLGYEQQLVWPMRQLGRLLADAGKAKVASGRIAELLAVKAETALDSGRELELKGEVVFEHVDFSYPDGKAVLFDLNFRIAPGEVLAVLGPTGSGKSSLVHLLARLYEPSAGRILIDGRDSRVLAKRPLRRQIALVLQEPFLFGKSIRDNLRLAWQGAHESAIERAAATACFSQVVEGFERGYDTMVGERGVTLSGGQRQRLALARALVKEAGILILDDSLSAVDTETDAAIRQALARRERRATTIIIAHRITTLASADRILVLERGRVSALGSHAELVAQPGLYQRLWRLQGSLDDGAPAAGTTEE